MGEATLNEISCSNCGEALDPSWAHMSERPWCPVCGEKGVAIHLGIAEEINIASEMSVVLQPVSSQRNWRQRWTEIETQWTEIDRPITSVMRGDGINSAHHRLQAFFVQAYHLKDALIADPSSGLSKKSVEAAITQDPRLALLADMANLDKHYRLTSTPRSGSAPVVGQVSGIQPGSGGSWRLQLEVTHNGQVRDGLDIARDAIEGWRNQLSNWQLI